MLSAENAGLEVVLAELHKEVQQVFMPWQT